MWPSRLVRGFVVAVGVVVATVARRQVGGRGSRGAPLWLFCARHVF